jgi:hypothetical protein
LGALGFGFSHYVNSVGRHDYYPPTTSKCLIPVNPLQHPSVASVFFIKPHVFWRNQRGGMRQRFSEPSIEIQAFGSAFRITESVNMTG